MTLFPSFLLPRGGSREQDDSFSLLWGGGRWEKESSCSLLPPLGRSKEGKRVILLPTTSSGGGARREKESSCSLLPPPKMLCAFCHPVVTCLVFECSMSHRHVICRNTSQQGDQARATCYAQQCWDMLRSNVAIGLAGACKCWADNVGICCAEMLRSFGAGGLELY